MNSALYDCRVTHERLEPRNRFFAYRVFYLWLDLDELGPVGRASGLLSVGPGRVYAFHESDHWPIGSGSLKERVLNWFRDRAVDIPEGARVRLLAMPRVLGYAFNPISFFFLQDASGRTVAAAAEVENTFRERKLYLLGPGDRDQSNGLTTRVPKEFYVSPFVDLDVEFEFCFRTPGDSVDLRVNDLRDGIPVFRSRLAGRRLALNSGNLLRLSVACPLVSLKVITLIHWQALLLWLGGHRWFAKSAGRDRQRGVINPHKSIAQSSS